MPERQRFGLTRPSSLVLPLYAGTMFLSAFLLFAVQPMFIKMVLPLMGGAPAVWNTAMVFFQAMLLAGYLYAHLGIRFLGLRRQALLHIVVLLLPLVVLPITVAEGWLPSASSQQIPWLLALLGVSVGLPFFVVSSTAPLLQRWFAQTGHPSADDPYFLYGSSNLGSLLALLSYPVVIEPMLGLRAQSFWWTAGYAGLATTIVVCAAVLRRRSRHFKRTALVVGERGLIQDITWALRARWLLLSFAPSALLLGVTLHISTDVAAVPLIWVVPLSLYLLTFVLVFARRPPIPHNWMIVAQTVVVASVVVFFQVVSLFALFFLHLAGLFLTAMVCHGEMARLRPVAPRLTEFYLFMSLGGVLGGLFAGVLAPVLFDAVYEYPAALILALLLRPMPKTTARFWIWVGRLSGLIAVGRRLAAYAPRVAGVLTRFRPLPWLLDATLPLLLWWALMNDRWERVTVDALSWSFEQFPRLQALPFWYIYSTLIAVTLILALVLLARRPLRFALAVALSIAVLAGNQLGSPAHLLSRERTFFGVHTVNFLQLRSGQFHVFLSGTTIHGAQQFEGEEQGLPVTYYTRDGPVGLFFSAARQAQHSFEDIAVIGLGVGSLSCYAHTGENITFFEIDPAVERIARDERYFTFLSDCGRDAEVRIGDGRLKIAAEPDESFDLIVLDAFSSDAIPVHLLTREAFQVYLRKLKPDGLLLVHITNEYLDLQPVISNVAADLGLAARILTHRASQRSRYQFPSDWVAIGRTVNDVAMLDRSPRKWVAMEPKRRHGVWTDDFSNIVRVLRWDIRDIFGR